MKMSNVLVLGLLSLSLNAFAGDRGGNGGDAVVCPSGVVMLDSVEMTKRKLTLSLPGQTIAEKVSSVIGRVDLVDKYRAGLLKKFSQEMIVDIEAREQGSIELPNIDFSTDTLVDVPDSLETSIPANCTKEQLVIQKEPTFPEDRRYSINENLFDQMDVDQKALMVLHESWYRIFLSEGALDSRFARYMNGLFASKEKSKLGLLEYFKTLKYSKKIGSIVAEYYVEFAGQRLVVWDCACTYQISGDPYVMSSYKFPQAYFNEDGLMELSILEVTENIMVEGQKLEGLRVKSIFLNQKSELVSVKAEYFNSLYGANFNFRNVSIRGGEFKDMILDHVGRVKSFRAKSVFTLSVDGKLVKNQGFFTGAFDLKVQVQDGRVIYEIK